MNRLLAPALPGRRACHHRADRSSEPTKRHHSAQPRAARKAAAVIYWGRRQVLRSGSRSPLRLSRKLSINARASSEARLTHSPRLATAAVDPNRFSRSVEVFNTSSLACPEAIIRQERRLLSGTDPLQFYLSPTHSPSRRGTARSEFLEYIKRGPSENPKIPC